MRLQTINQAKQRWTVSWHYADVEEGIEAVLTSFCECNGALDLVRESPSCQVSSAYNNPSAGKCTVGVVPCGVLWKTEGRKLKLPNEGNEATRPQAAGPSSQGPVAIEACGTT
ncbi:hypothetical protein HaLaN_20938 [Haematococcus lacustris]|uniref:Uncharacterized protein n=1 Tax=Haematococcus lacustris TaxID=44745 RepID=A0A699ZUP2_HAELA|nr:hypothetical protein HaLaN_20938 [Haematococcus lacustris]